MTSKFTLFEDARCKAGPWIGELVTPPRFHGGFPVVGGELSRYKRECYRVNSIGASSTYLQSLRTIHEPEAHLFPEGGRYDG